jgi:hypothetical protein
MTTSVSWVMLTVLHVFETKAFFFIAGTVQRPAPGMDAAQVSNFVTVHHD